MKTKIDTGIFKKGALADLLGIKPYTFSYYITGRVKIPAEVEAKLNIILQVGKQLEQDAFNGMLENIVKK